jgi:Double zinc ribbon
LWARHFPRWNPYTPNPTCKAPMDVRDFVQAVTGAVILRPDNILVASALSNGVFASTYFANAQSGDPIVEALSIAHVFLLTAGLGLLLGVGLTSSVAIGFFVVIGVAGGLFAIGSVLQALGPQFYAAAYGAQGTLSSLVVQPYLADAYLVLPLVVFAAGAYRWDRTTKVKRLRAVQATHLSLRQYCTFCGARHEPGASSCAQCGKSVDAGSGSFCTDCGKPLSRKAVFCGYCGAEVLRGEGATCQVCGTSASPSAKYCNDCGARIRSIKPPEGATTQGS